MIAFPTQSSRQGQVRRSPTISGSGEIAIGDVKISGDWELSLKPKLVQDGWLKTEWTGEGQFRQRYWLRRYIDCPAASFKALMMHLLLNTNLDDYRGAKLGTLLFTKAQWANGLLAVTLLHRPSGWTTPLTDQVRGAADFARIFD